MPSSDRHNTLGGTGHAVQQLMDDYSRRQPASADARADVGDRFPVKRCGCWSRSGLGTVSKRSPARCAPVAAGDCGFRRRSPLVQWFGRRIPVNLG